MMKPRSMKVVDFKLVGTNICPNIIARQSSFLAGFSLFRSHNRRCDDDDDDVSLTNAKVR
jgi:hypothetical protein